MMDPRAAWLILALQCCVTLAQGPVFNGGPAAAVENQPAPSGNIITQTVYGFLDFTTTIGNTVMVFSPNSAPPPEPPPSKSPAIQVNVIETKPPKLATPKPEVNPSKTLKDSQLQDKKPLTSVVSVLEEKKFETVKPFKANEIKSVVSKVEIVAGTTKFADNKKSTPKPTTTKPKPTTPKPKEPIIKQDKPIYSSKVEVKENEKATPLPNLNVIQQRSFDAEEEDEEPAILVPNNNLGEPEYDFLSREPSEFVEETYKLVNLKPSKAHHPRPKNKLRQPIQPSANEDDEHPIGLVTTLGGTVVKDGHTTIHETSVIGTYISGKYAQVLHSSSKVIQPSHKQKISPSPTLRILKTAAPNLNKNHRYNLEPTPAASISEETSVSYENNIGKSSKRAVSSGNFKNRFRNHNNAEDDFDNSVNSVKKNKKNNNVQPPQQTQRTYSTRKYGRSSNTPQLATVSVFSESSSASYSSRRKNNRNGPSFKSSVAPISNTENHPRRGFKPRVQPSSVDQFNPAGSTSLYKFKLNRPSGRWQYKTTPKPRVTIRKMMGDDDQQTTPNSVSTAGDDNQSNELSVQSRVDNDLDLSGSHSGPGQILDEDAEDNSIEKSPPVETIKVEISTPADFKDVYYEIATLRSPYTFQVGRVKNTRIITVTTTIAKSLEPTVIPSAVNVLNEPLTENILATASPYDKDHHLLESSIATLPPITLSSDMETPPLETITETFSTTQDMLKTHILPIVRGGNITSSLTFTQTYHVTRFVTATKTLPPMDFFQFIPSKTLKEFNSRLDEAGSELHLELDFGDSNEDDENAPSKAFPPDLDLANVGSDFDLSEVDKYHLADNHLRLKKAHSSNPKVQHVTEPPTPPTPALSPEQAQQLALLRLLNPAAAAQIPSVVTTSKPVLKYETVYESHVIPVFNGKNTILSTISRAVATKTKTEYEIGTSSLPAIPLNPLLPLQQLSVTSTPVVQQTEVTATESQILKLTFGAKTVYTTLYSTKVVPTLLTTYITQSLPVVHPSAAPFPNPYFPSPFAQFPYVG